MRKANSYYKEDEAFDLIQKNKRNSNYSNNMSVYTGDYNNMSNLKSSKISQASIYLSGLLNEIKESLVNEEDIFSEFTSQNHKNSNYNIEKDTNRSYCSIISPINNLNINNNNNAFNLENKNKIKKYVSYKKEVLQKKLHESTDDSNLTQRKNTITLSKKSSLRQREIKRYSCLLNPTQKFVTPFRTSTLNTKNGKSVKFDIPKKTNTNFTKKNNNYTNNNINISLRRWSEIKDKRKNRENSLFSFFQRPELFENQPRKTQSIEFRNFTLSKSEENDNYNEKFFTKQLSNKNIIQLNEITQDLKKTIIVTKKPSNFKLSQLNKKDFLYDHQDSFDDEKKKDYKMEIKLDLKSKYDKENKYRELQKKSCVYDSLDEYNDVDISTFFIHPESKYLKYLDCIISICVIYNLIYIPLFLGYNNNYCKINDYISFTSFIDLLIDFIYFIDFIIHFFVAYFNSDDILRTENYLIIINNLKGWFIIDLISFIPFKTIFNFFDTKCKDVNFLSSNLYQSHFYYLLICLRLIKTFRLHHNRFLEYIDELLDKYDHYNNYYTFYLISFIFFITLHVVTCLLIFIGKNDYPNWIIYFNIKEYNFSKLYFLGIYYIITTVTTVGYGDLYCYTTKEKILAILIEIVGIVAYSYILTSISNYVKSKSDSEEEYFKKYQILENIKMNYEDLSDDLFERIDRFLKHKQNNEDQEKNLIDELPITLKNNLVYSMYEPIIENFIFFKNFDNKDFIVKVIFSFKPILAIKNDILIKDGDFIEDIIFVKKGKLTLDLPIKIVKEPQKKNTNKSNKLDYSTLSMGLNNNIKTQSTKYLFNNNNDEDDFFEEEDTIEYRNYKILDIRKNEHFGEVLMLSNERSPLIAIVKSRKAELFYLNKKDAIDISNDYPQIWSKIEKKSYFNMRQIKKLMVKISKIIYSTNGMKQEEMSNSNISKSMDSDLQSIPSISDYNNNNSPLKNKYKEINNLKTIKEATIIEDSENSISKSKGSNSSSSSSSSSISNSSSSISSSNSNNNSLNNVRTKKISNNNDSSNYDSIKSESIDTIKIENNNNINVEFSEIYSEHDISSRCYNSKRGLLTPYKPDEINMEIYPNETFTTNENYTRLNYNNNNTNQKNNNRKKNCSNKKITNKNCKKIEKINKFNINDISMCSTEISFSINSKYENIDELSDYKYSKTPKLRKKIKSILKDYEDLESYYSTKLNKKSTNSFISANKIKLNDFKKSSSTDLKKKKIRNKRREISSDNLLTFSSFKKSKFNILDIIMEKNNFKQNEKNNNDSQNFSDLISNFINNGKTDKEELSKNIVNIKTFKDKKNITIQSSDNIIQTKDFSLSKNTFES